MRRSIALALFAAALLAVGCKKDDPTVEDKGRTFLHVVSAVPNDTFNITFDYWNADDVVIKDFVYRRNFPIVGYADMEAGGTPDEFGNGKLYLSASRQPFIDIAPDTLMPPRDILLTKDEKSTICIADSAGSMRFLKIKDEFDFATDTTTAIRFINLSNTQVTASLASADGSINIANVAFWNSSTYSNAPHGQYTVELRDGSGTVLSSVSLWLGGRTAYSFFAVGNSLDYFIH
jgi:hypothetical protein